MSDYLSQDDLKTSNTDWNSIRVLLSLAGPHRTPIFFALGLMVAAQIAAVTSAWTLGHLIEDGVRRSNYHLALTYGFITLALEIAFIFFYYFGRKLLARESLKVIFEVRDSLFTKLQRLPMSYFDTQPLGRTVTRLTHDVENLETFFSGSMPRLVGAFLSLLMVSIAMILTDWKLGLILFASILPSLLVTLAYRRPIRKYQQEFSRSNSAINARLNELLNGLGVIRAFGLENWSKTHFNHEASLFLKSALNINQINSWARPTVSLLAIFPVFVLVWFGVPMVASGALTIGLLVTFLRYCERFYRPINTISQEIHQLQNAFAYLDRVLTLVHETEEDQSLPQGSVLLTEKPVGIRFENLWMRYQEHSPWVLKGLSLDIRPGETLGLVGRTGCGKTTLVSVLARLYEFQKGDLLVQGVSIRDYRRDSLRNALGFITQDVVIFEASLSENLCLGNPYPLERILLACKLSGLSSVMDRNHLTLESPLLDKGANLSVGERQLLALTRIFLARPSLIILDEATANIDPEIEHFIQSALKSHLKETTCLIIAHRLNTLDLCDRVAVLKEGALATYLRPPDLAHYEHFSSEDLLK